MEYTIYNSPMDDPLFFEDAFSKWQAWYDLRLLSEASPAQIFVRGIKINTEKDCVYKGTRELAERWKWSRDKVKRFLEMLIQENRILVETGNIISRIKILHKSTNKSTHKSTHKSTKFSDENTETEIVNGGVKTAGESTNKSTNKSTKAETSTNESTKFDSGSVENKDVNGGIKLVNESTNKSTKSNKEENKEEREKNQKRIEVIREENIEKENYRVNSIVKERENAASRSRVFIPPKIEEVEAYIQAKGYRFSAEAFMAYYQSNGWMVGKTKMKDWRAATRTWELKRKNEGYGNYYNRPNNRDYDKRRSAEVTATCAEDYEGPF